jgi:hypothetical protein
MVMSDPDCVGQRWWRERKREKDQKEKKSLLAAWMAV